MDKKRLKVKTSLNFFGTYKEVSQVADISTTLKTNIEDVHIISGRLNMPSRYYLPL